MRALLPLTLLFGAASAPAHVPKAKQPTIPKYVWGEWREDNRSQCGSTDVGNRILFGARLWDMQGTSFAISSLKFRGRNSFSVYTKASKYGSPFASFDYDAKTDTLIRDSEVSVYRCPTVVKKAP